MQSAHISYSIASCLSDFLILFTALIIWFGSDRDCFVVLDFLKKYSPMSSGISPINASGYKVKKCSLKIIVMSMLS